MAAYLYPFWSYGPNILRRINTCSLSNPKLQCPSQEAKRFWASQKLTRTLWNPQFQLHVQTSPLIVPTFEASDPNLRYPIPSLYNEFSCQYLKYTGLPGGLFPSGFHSKILTYYFSSLSVNSFLFIRHCPPILQWAELPSFINVNN